MRNYDSRELITEVRRIQEMMGVTNHKIISEALVGGGILDEILGLFIKKGGDDFAQLGFKSADEMSTFADEIASATDDAAKTLLIKKVLPNLGSDVMKSVADDILDGSSTLANNFKSNMDAIVDQYGAAIKGASDPDALIKQLSDLVADNTSGAIKIGDELSSLKTAIDDAMTSRTKSAFEGFKPTKVSDDVASELTNSRIAADIVADKNAKVQKVLDDIKGRPSYDQLISKYKTQVDNVVKSNADMTYDDLLAKAEIQINKIISDPNFSSANRTFIKKSWDYISTMAKNNPGKFIAGAIILSYGVMDNWGEIIQFFKGLFKETLYNIASTGTPEDNQAVVTPGTTCPITLDGFKAYLDSVGLGDYKASAVWDVTKCTGSAEGAGFTYLVNQDGTGAWK